MVNLTALRKSGGGGKFTLGKALRGSRHPLQWCSIYGIGAVQGYVSRFMMVHDGQCWLMMVNDGNDAG